MPAAHLDRSRIREAPPGHPPLIVTEANVRPADAGMLRAYVGLTLNEAVVLRGIRLIDPGPPCRWFLAFPDSKRRLPCVACAGLVAFDDMFCRHCGYRQPPGRERELDGIERGPRARRMDDAFPITRAARLVMEQAAIAAYFAVLGAIERGEIDGPAGAVRFAPGGGPVVAVAAHRSASCGGPGR